MEVSEPFSSEKGSEPPEALAAKPRTGAKRQKREKSAKGFENGQSPFSLRFCANFWFARENKSFPLTFELALANENAFVG